MSIPDKSKYVTVEEYLRAEELSQVKHEYVDGRIYVMSGVSLRHNTIAVNIGSALRVHVRGSQCRAFISDVKLRVEATNSFYYPDVMVSCSPHKGKSVFINSPVLVVEVLSRSTAAIDRREKMLAYKTIESLKEYLVVSQSRQRVELHLKNDAGIWSLFEFGPGDELMLESASLKLSLSEIYEDADVPQGGTGRVREHSEAYGEEDPYEDEGGEESDLEW